MKEGWTYKKLGEVCSLLTDGNWIESKDQSPEGIRLIQTGNIGNGVYRDKSEHSKYISEKTFIDLNCTEIFEGDILISRLPDPIGRACIIPSMPGRMITAVDCSIIRLRDFMNPKFFIYCTLSNDYKKGIEKYSTGATRKRVSRSNLALIPLPVPSLNEQLKIVSELDLLSGVIEKQKVQLEELDKLAQSIFYDMFGDPVTNKCRWETKLIKEFCEVTSSKRIFANEYCENGIPFYRGKEITEKSKAQPISVELFISNEKYSEIRNNFGVPSNGDILITAVGTIGNIWVVNENNPFYFKDGNIIWLKGINNINSTYFRYILTILIDAYKNEMAQGCAYNALTIVNLKKMSFSYPPLALQQEFAAKIEAIEAMKAKVRQSLKESETLFNSRMDYYFN